jgi:hypothetical protein
VIAPGNHTQTKARSALEIIVGSNWFPYSLGEKRKPVVDALHLKQAEGTICIEESNADQSGGLKRDTQPHREVAVFDLAHRDPGDTNPVCELLEGPTTLPARLLDPSTEELSCLDCDWRNGTGSLHTE